MEDAVYRSQPLAAIVPETCLRETSRGDVSGEKCLLQLRYAVDDTESDVVAELNLNHLCRETFADLIHVVHCEVDLPAASLHEVIKQEGRKIADFLVVGMLTEIQNLRHDAFNVSPWWSTFIAESR